jgi:hypothetical protein
VPGHVRDRARSATEEGKRVLLALDVADGARWSADGTGEAAGGEA